MSLQRGISTLTLIRQLWRQASLPSAILENTIGCGHVVLAYEPVESGQAVRSSFQITAVAQACAAVIGLAERLRCALLDGQSGEEIVLDRVVVDGKHAVAEWTGWLRVYAGESADRAQMLSGACEASSEQARQVLGVDEYAIGDWDSLAGLYRTSGNRWVRIHTNFPHHKLGVLQLLDLAPATARWDDDDIQEVFSKVQRDDVERELAKWQAFEFEAAAQAKGLCVTAYRTRDEWVESEMGRAVREWMEGNAGGGAFRISRISSAQPSGRKESRGARLKVIDMSRVIAGPICSRTLAAYGADVLLLSSARLPNLPLRELDTARGKRTAFIDLPDGARSLPEELRQVIAEADVFSQAYRPGGLAERGLSAEEVQTISPGIVYAELRAFGFTGPWANRRAYDSLTQTACGMNYLESLSHRSDAQEVEPRALPIQALDYAAGSLMCFAILACKCRALLEGKKGEKEEGWKVEVSLASTAEWIVGLGQLEDGDEAWVKPPEGAGVEEEMVSAYRVRGLENESVKVLAVRHAGLAEDEEEEEAGGLRWTVPANLNVDRVEWV